MKPPPLQLKAAPAVRSRSAPAGVIQCAFGKISVARVDPVGAHVLAIRQFIESVRVSVDKAYQYVLSTPTLGVLANLDGHTQHWVRKWKVFVETGQGQLMAAAFGYAVESVATHAASPFKPTAPSGTEFKLQSGRNGTRPDVILTPVASTTEIAWVDITASNSIEHIFTQKVGWMDQTNVAEITYPSTEMATIQSMAGTMPGVAIDPGEIFRNIGFQQLYLQQLRAIFVEQGQTLFGHRSLPRADPILRDKTRRDWTLRILSQSGPLRGIHLDEPAAASILYAMGLDPATYGFRGSTNKSTGEHLLKTFQQVPMLTAPRQTVPLPLSGTSGGGLDFRALFQGGRQGGNPSGPLPPQPSIGERIRRAHPSNRSLAHHHGSTLARGPQGITDTARRLGRTFTRLGERGFTMQNLYSLLVDSGVPLQSIRKCNLVVRDSQGEECFHLSYSQLRGAQIRKMPHTLSLRGARSPLALTSPQMPLGEIVHASPSQSFQLVAYQVETEEDEVIAGINSSLV